MSQANSNLYQADRHETQAREYRRLAHLLRRRDRADAAAGALLYEAAKQCINAVANQRGANPGTTGGKYRFLHDLAAQEAPFHVLLDNWRSANDLHLNADRLAMNNEEFHGAWSLALDFIEQMLQIYYRSERVQ